MKVKVRKILLCVFFALFIVTLFTASFSLGRYSSVQSSESNYDDDFEYTLYDSIVVNTIDEFFAAISNGYNYIIIGDAIKDPLIIAGSMSDIRDDLIIDLNGHEIQRNSRDPLLNVTTGFTLTIIDSEGTGSMYNPVGSVIQVNGGTLTVQNGIFESGPRSDNSRDGDNYEKYNEYAIGSNNNWTTPGGGSISSGPAAVTLYTNPIIKEGGVNSPDSDKEYGDSQAAELPIIMPQSVPRYRDEDGNDQTVVNGSMYFDENTNPRYGSLDNNNYIIENDTYLYYTFESDNMQYSTAADKSTANYYYQYYVAGGDLGDTQDSVDSYFTYAGYEGDGSTHDNNILVTVYVFNDVKYYAAEQSGYTDSSGTPGFAAVKMQSGNLYVRGGTYYSYFGEDNTFGVQSTGGLMSVNPTGSNAIYFYAYQNGVCVDCRTTSTTVNEMLNISSGNFYSELGDTVRVKNGNLVIGTADFTKDVGSYSGETTTTWGRNGSVIDISGGTLTINNSADFDITGSYINGIYSHGGTNSSVRVTNAEFTFSGTTDLVYNCGILAAAGSVTCYGETTIDLSNGDNHNIGIYSAGGTIELGQSRENVTTRQTTINVATVGTSSNNYGIYSEGGSISGYGTTQITLGNLNSATTNSQGIYSEGGEIHLGQTQNETAGQTEITVNGNKEVSNNVVASHNNFGIHAIGGEINTYGTTSVTVYGTNSTGVYATVPDKTSTSSINISGSQFNCYVYDMPQTLPNGYTHTISSTAVSTEGGEINFNVAGATITSDGFGITASNTIYVNNTSQEVNADNAGRVQLTAPENTTTTPTVGLTSRNSTAIYIYGGELLVNSGITLNVNSTIRPYGWASRNNTVSTTNGIYIVGGSFTSHGAVNITNEVTGNWYSDGASNMFSVGGIANTKVSNFNGIFIDGGSFESSDAENSTALASLSLINNINGTYSEWNGNWLWGQYQTNSSWYSFDNSSYSGIYVNGGSFTATGTGSIRVGEDTDTGLYVSHQGVQNDDVGEGNNENTTADNAYYAFNIKSYALRIEGQNTTDAQVTILTGSIENSVGGGVYVSNGTVNLGTQQINNSLSVVTTGHEQYQTVGVGGGHMWYYTIPKTGGHAVQVSGGILNIFNGTYTANQGNGIVVNGGTANVHTGTFLGYDQGSDQNQLTGPGASAGLKVIGGNANIFGGSYGKVGNSNSGGAFVMGLSSNQKATVKVLGGTFNATGADTFTIFRYSTVTFDPENKHNTVQNSISNGGAISVIGNGASAIALTNDLIYNATDRGSTVNIYGGAFSSEKNIDNDAVWCGCSADTLNIYGGTFSGRRYGINVSEGRVNIDRDSAVISGWTAQINGNINWV